MKPALDLNMNQIDLYNFDKLVDSIFGIFKKMGYVHPGIMMFDEERKILYIPKIFVPKQVSYIVNTVLNKDIEEIQFKLEDESSIVKAFKTKKIVQEPSVVNFGKPLLSEKTSKIVNSLLRIKQAVAVPILLKNEEAIGVFTFGLRSNEKLTNDEITFLYNLCSELGHFIKAAWLLYFKDNQNKALLKERENLAKFIRIKQDFLYSVDKLFVELGDSKEISEDKREEIKKSSQYLRSLFLLAETMGQKYEPKQPD